jgi:myosin V
MQATKLLQLKKVDKTTYYDRAIRISSLFSQATPADIEIIYDVCWMLSPMQIQRMCTNYYVADYEVRLSPYFIRKTTHTMGTESDLTGNPPSGRLPCPS